MMGLEAHMGLEEQEGLFGERIFEKHTENWQDLYYKGLIINILAQTTKKSNKYVFAQSLLDQSPSAVLSNLEDTKIKKELLEKVFLFLIRANLKISEWKGGKYTMKEILQDAAFLLSGFLNSSGVQKIMNHGGLVDQNMSLLNLLIEF